MADKALPLPALHSTSRRRRAAPGAARRMMIAPAALSRRQPVSSMGLVSVRRTVLPLRMPAPVSRRPGVRLPPRLLRQIGIVQPVPVSRGTRSAELCARQLDRSPAAQARRSAASRYRAISFRADQQGARMRRASGARPARRHRAVYWNPSPPHVLCVTMHDRQRRVSPVPRHRMLAYSSAAAQQNDYVPAHFVDCRRVRSKYGERVMSYSAGPRNTRLALVPPNPKEFDNTTLTGRLRA